LNTRYAVFAISGGPVAPTANILPSRTLATAGLAAAKEVSNSLSPLKLLGANVPFAQSGTHPAIGKGMENSLSTATALPPRAPEMRFGRSVSINQAAELLSLSRRTIYYWIQQGRLQTIRTLGGSQRILVESLRLDSRLRAHEARTGSLPGSFRTPSSSNA
jgi:excisionase family DNA binding protein